MPDYIKKQLPKSQAYEHWLSIVNELKSDLTICDRNDRDRSFDIAFRLFPLIESISKNLFSKNGRYYLEKLGYTNVEADLAFRVFRNGLLHVGVNSELVYNDGKITWGMDSSRSNSVPSNYDPGYQSEDHPSDNIPQEKVIEYIKIDNSESHISICLDRLLMQIGRDLEQRMGRDNREFIEIIVGERINKDRPK